MDARLRLLERMDRPRWLVECHRRGIPVLYRIGDEVRPVFRTWSRPYPGRWRIIGAEPESQEFGPARFVLQSVDWGTQLQCQEVVPYGC